MFTTFSFTVERRGMEMTPVGRVDSMPTRGTSAGTRAFRFVAARSTEQLHVRSPTLMHADDHGGRPAGAYRLREQHSKNSHRSHHRLYQNRPVIKSAISPSYQHSTNRLTRRAHFKDYRGYAGRSNIGGQKNPQRPEPRVADCGLACCQLVWGHVFRHRAPPMESSVLGHIQDGGNVHSDTLSALAVADAG